MGVPEEPWFKQTLLYWDKVGSIIPDEALTSPELSSWTQETIREGLVYAIDPRVTVGPSLDDGFVRLVESSPEWLANLSGANTRRTSQLHIAKMGYRLLQQFRELGLVDRDARLADEVWVSMPPRLAEAYMAYVAVAVGIQRSMDPVTNRPTAVEALTDLKVGGTAGPIAHARTQVRLFGELLPVPMSPVSAKEIRDFKETHHDLLKSFRRRIEQSSLQVAGSPTGFFADRTTDLLIDEMRDDVRQIRERMEQRHWSVRPARLLGLVPVVQSISDIASNSVGLQTVVDVVGLVGSILNVVDSRHSWSYQGEPLAYAALAHQQFGRSYE